MSTTLTKIGPKGDKGDPGDVGTPGAKGDPGEPGPRPSQACRSNQIFLHPAMGITALEVRPVPPLIPGETCLRLFCSLNLQAALTDSTGVELSMDECDIDGNIPSGGGNISFGEQDLQNVNGYQFVSFAWPYDPRLEATPPDVDLGDGSGRYLGLHLTAIGDWIGVGAIYFSVEYAGDTTTLDETSTSLHDGKGFKSGF